MMNRKWGSIAPDRRNFLEAALLLATVMILCFPSLLVSQTIQTLRQDCQPVLDWDLTKGTGTGVYSGLPDIRGGKISGNTYQVSDAGIETAPEFSGPGSALLVDSLNASLANAFTISAWIKVLAGKRMNRIILSGSSAVRSSPLFVLWLDSLTGFMRFNAPDLSGNMNSEVRMDDNQWHHIAVTYSQGYMKFYEDGSIVKAGAVKGRIENPVHSISIGGIAGKNNSLWGSISHVKIYDLVLNSIKIHDLYTKKLSGWNLNEGTGVGTFEQSGEGTYRMPPETSWRTELKYRDGMFKTGGSYGRLHKAAWEADARFGNVINFDSAGSGVFIQSPGRINLRDRFTISVWLRASPGINNHRIILAKGAPGKSYFDLRLDSASGYLEFHCMALSGNTSSRFRVDDNNWHHIAVTYQHGQMKFYKDGILVCTRTVTGAIPDADASLAIGSRTDGTCSFRGSLSRLRIFGSAFTRPQVRDLYNELETAAWDLAEGNGNIAHDNSGRGNNGIVRGAGWILGKGSSFTHAVDFKDGARVTIKGSGINPGDEFTISAWLLAPRSRGHERIIMVKGSKGNKDYFALQLDPVTGHLSFRSPALSGDMNSGFNVDDSVWHHIMISYGAGMMKFYKDRQLMKISRVTGSLNSSAATLAIGATAQGGGSFGGSLARIKIYNSVKAIDEVTSVVPPAGPVLNLKRGIAFDRYQKRFPIRPGMEITAGDVAVAREMGFDHIKVLFTADSYILGSKLNMPNMAYVEKVINTALGSGLPVLVCIHPEPDFKFFHLGSADSFAQLLGFYSEFARYLARRWKPDQIALQLMTEPHGKNFGPEFQDWNILYPQIVETVRKYMQDYTLVIPGDRVGSLYGMTSMVPIADDNVYYSFTSHEPFQFGMNARFGDYMGAGTYWKDISYIPWPASPAVIEGRMAEMLSTVPEEERPGAERDLIAYGNAYYNRQWLNMRADQIRDWNDSYGGNLHVMVVEFGCIDPVWVRKYGASKGVYPNERLSFLRDVRESFEQDGIGWDYWSFNEACTALNPFTRAPFKPASMDQVEDNMLYALGLK